jgi:hypothetical protein
MLTKRHLTEVLLASQGVASPHVDTGVLLLEHVTALISGGEIRAQLGSNEVIHLPPAPTEDIRRPFLEQQRLLHSLLAQNEVFLRLSPADQAYGSHVPHVFSDDWTRIYIHLSDLALHSRHLRDDPRVGLFLGVGSTGQESLGVETHESSGRRRPVSRATSTVRASNVTSIASPNRQ